MSGFLLGIVITAVVWGADGVCRKQMEKVYGNNPKELKKIKLPLYPIWLFFKFKKKEVLDD